MRNILQNLILVFTVNITALAQHPIIFRHTPKLTSPITFPIIPSGTFAEPRLDHFHGGLDIKTQGIEGLPVIAPEDGYISRIKVAKNGYGQALYVIHNNGITTVYGHLSRYNNKIQQYLRDMQYAKQAFEVDFTIPKSMLYIHKGDTIAFTGNTGSSGGPHLHFETRDTYSECPRNPQIFGISTKDLWAPEVTKVYLHIFDSSVYTGNRIEVPVYADERKHNYYIAKQIEVSLGKLAVSVEACDRHQKSFGNYNGIYKMILKKDNAIIFQYSADSFCFEQQRYVNAMFNYEKKLLKGIDEHYLFKLPGNRFSGYNSNNDGVIINNSLTSYDLEIILMDYDKNKTIINIPIKVIPKQYKNSYTASNFSKANTLQSENALLTIMPNTFYDNYYLSLYDTVVSASKAVVVKSRPYLLPFHMDAELTFKNIYHFQNSEKVIGTYINPKGFSSAVAVTARGDTYSAAIRGTGIYLLKEDNEKPNIQFHRYDNQQNRWYFYVSDNGILQSYNAYWDEQWILLQYDAKNNIMFYEADNKASTGVHTLKLVVTDINKNTNTFYKQINY
jgi:hypothetical protein